MVYDKKVADRVRSTLGELPGLVEKKMFGGVGYMVMGNMACGVNKDDLIVRVGPERYEESVQLPHARPFDFTGRPMKGWVMVAPAGYESEQDLVEWIQRGVEFALTLPPK
jgi:TfoX/Sxy family transcriptional regulator of competence genes